VFTTYAWHFSGWQGKERKDGGRVPKERGKKEMVCPVASCAKLPRRKSVHNMSKTECSAPKTARLSWAGKMGHPNIYNFFFRPLIKEI
jgi:hypothetical protein